VLLAEANPATRAALAAQMTAWGARVTEAETPEELRRLLDGAAEQGRPYDLALVDAALPAGAPAEAAAEARGHPGLAGGVLALGGGPHRREESKSLREQRLEAVLVKPLSYAELGEAVGRVLGLALARPTSRATDAEGTPGPGGLRVLLAEDNPVNQQVALGLLHRWGHEVQVADNGEQALRALEADHFDLVLMDVQMPGMDGLEATRRQRQREGDGRRRMPIVAMTAHAMAGDRERCLAAGMDEYLAKPLDPAQLWEVMCDLAPARACADISVNRRRLTRRLGGDEDLAQQLAKVFLEEYPGLVGDMRAAVSAGDAEAVAQTAHTVKGSVGYFEAAGAMEAARELEALGRAGSLAGAPAVLERLEAELDQVRRELEELAAPPSAG
jgi:CheY-like chemotaxis protein